MRLRALALREVGMRIYVPILLCCTGIAACTVGDRSGDDAAASVIALADDYVSGYFSQFPDDATSFGYPDADHGRLRDNSLASVRAWQAREDAWLEQLRAIDPSAVAGTEAEVPYGFLREQLEGSVGFRACRMELWNVSPTWTGWQNSYSALASLQPVGSREELAQALSRYRELPRFLQAEIENLREGLRLGLTAPRNNVESVIEQMDGLLAARPEDSPFYSPAGRAAPPEFGAELLPIVTEEIRPAIKTYRDFLVNEYLPEAREEIAVAANPDGADCYRAAIRYHTTLDMPPQEIRAMGLRQMAQIRSEMQEIAERSFDTSDVSVLLQSLKSDPKYTFASRQEIIDYAQAAVDRARAAVPDWFGIVPQAEVVIEPYAPFQEKSAPLGQYSSPAADGSRPGLYLINTYQPERQSRAGVESVAFHEAYPGHHLQGTIALERTGAHPVMRYFFVSGFGEGWGLYSERLADEMGLFSDDVARMGLLSNEAHRAARLVVDAGMHALGWSRQQAIDYLLENTTLAPANAAAEIDRYIAVPGQATSYMIGNLEIRRLREMAEGELGAGFDIKQFHDRVLEDGAVPLPMLGDKIKAWIDESR